MPFRFPFGSKKKRKARSKAPLCAQGDMNGYASRGGGTPEWESSTNPEDRRLDNGIGGSLTHDFSYVTSPTDGPRQLPSGPYTDTSGRFAEQNGAGCGIPCGGYGGGGGYGTPVPDVPDEEAVRRGREELQRLVCARSENSDTSIETTESRRELDHQEDPLLLYKRLPGFQTIRVVKCLNGKFGFNLKVENFKQEVSLPIVSDIEPTARFVRPTETLQCGDVLLAANNHVIVGLPKRAVEQALRQVECSEVDLSIIRAPGAWHDLCLLVRRGWAMEHGNNTSGLQIAVTVPREWDLPDDDGGDDEDPIPGSPPHVPSPLQSGIEQPCEPDVTISTELPSDCTPVEAPASFDITDEELHRMDKIQLTYLKPQHIEKFGLLFDANEWDWKVIAGEGGLSVEEINVVKPRATNGRCTEYVLNQLIQRRSMSLGKLCRVVRERKRMDFIAYVKVNVLKDLLEMERLEAEELRKLRSPSPLDTSNLSLTTDGSRDEFSDTPIDLSGPSSVPIVSQLAPHRQVPLQHEVPRGSPSKFFKRKTKAQGKKLCRVCLLCHDEYVYISYALDMTRYVDTIVAWLHTNGMAVHYDQMDEPGRAAKNAPVWKTEQLDRAKFILVLCSPGYIEQIRNGVADNRTGACQPGCGVFFDINYIASDIFQKGGNYRCIPVLVNGFRQDCVPSYLHNTHVYRYPDQEASIWRRLTNTREFVLPPLGPMRVIKPRKEW
ncbi:uncharacterized protein LOC134185759 isoform X2 [Corticium candelabrum]|uniref:uncharacterized protein LOC134185759 isoform X2 n=1 Tax=Corticium candelabrum TaxID=121492 RepID=UPI002E263518|nr:uncharacterized protein LOC134185759 isoform X2 [Corticium candelabrum]